MEIVLGMNEEIVAIFCGSLQDWIIFKWGHFYTFKSLFLRTIS